ncbi:MAG TPA: T9SS type A sorting domain-containing protein [Flavobacteriaceae bacterium]|nr:T9SS type A sorting domain-containing protein [Flavobacteriaceae bacterium]
MKKHLLFSLIGIVTLALCSVPTWAQTSPISETFENLGPYGGYQTETWTGDDGGTWTATDARTDQTINGKAITIRTGELTSPSVTGGIGSLTLNTQRKFGSGDHTAEVFVNDVSVGTVPYGTDVQSTTISDINVAGNVVVKIVNDAGGARIAIDDLQWTAYSSTDPLLSASPTSLSDFNYAIGEGPSGTQSFDVSGMNLDPSSGQITITAPTNYEISSDDTNYAPSLNIPYSGGSLSSTTVYVHSVEGLEAGDYEGDISISGGNASTINVHVTGTVTAPIEAPTLILSEIADPGDVYQARFVELYNNGSTTIDFSSTQVFLAKYSGTNTSPQSVQLTGSVAPGNFYVIAYSASDYNSSYGMTPDLESGIVSGNGDDTYALYTGGDWDNDGTLYDIYGEIGVDGTGEAWEYEDSRAARNDLSTSPNAIWNASEWNIYPADIADMTPGADETNAGIDYVFENGSWSPENPEGAATAADNIIIMNDTATLSQDFSIKDITVDAGATLKVSQVLSYAGNMVNNGTVIFKSGENIQGQLGIIDLNNSDFSGDGVIISERYIPARDDEKGAYRYLTSPLQSLLSIHYNWQENATGIDDNPKPGYGMFITGSDTGANGFDATPAGAPSMFEFNNNSQSYVPVANTDVLTLIQGKAYSVYVWGDRSVDILGPNGNDPVATSTTLEATGTLNPETLTITNLSQVAGEFNLIGNPYQAILNINSVISNSTNINPAHYYVWDPNLGTRGAFATVSLPTGTNAQSSEANQFLQVGQAVFVSTLDNGPASVTFLQTDKAVNETPTDVFRPQNLDAAYVRLQLFSSQAYATGNALSDAVQINFSADGNNAVLPNDALKIQNMDENVGIVNGTQILSIENRAIPVEGETIPLSMNQYRTNSYVFNISTEALPENLYVYLIDNYLDTETLLTPNDNTLVNFDIDQTIAGSTAPDRFSIFFTENSLSTESFLGKDLVLYPNPVLNDVFFIGNLQGGKASVELYNVLGQQVLNFENEVPSNGKISVKTTTLEPGMYIVNVIQNGSKKTTKILIE